MSLVVPSLSGGNLTTSAGTSSAATGAASALGGAVVANGTTTAMPFAQTLVQSMTGGTAKETETPLLGNLASLLQGLLNSVSSTGKKLVNRGAVRMQKVPRALSSWKGFCRILRSWMTTSALTLLCSLPCKAG